MNANTSLPAKSQDSKTHYTQGPWKAILHDGQFAGNHWQIVAASPHAEGLRQIVCELNGPWSRANYKANAKLIASVPDLLSACEYTASIMGDIPPMPETVAQLESASVELRNYLSALRGNLLSVSQKAQTILANI